MRVVGRRFDTGETVAVETSADRIGSVLPAPSADALPWLAPGFVDLQVNALGGQGFNDPELTVEKIARVSRALDESGVIRYCPTATTQSFAVLSRTLKTLAAGSEAILGKLRRVLLAHDGIRTAVASGPRLWDLATGSATSPFLDGFLPPLYVGALGAESSEALIRQRHLPPDARPEFSDGDVEAICRWGGGHPFLLQLLAKRFVELEDADRAMAALVADRSVTSLFEIDLDLLDADQRAVLASLAHGRDIELDATSPALRELENLGLVSAAGERGIRVTPPLLEVWLASSQFASSHSASTIPQLFSVPPPQTPLVHVSFTVQNSPSSQIVPSGSSSKTHTP